MSTSGEGHVDFDALLNFPDEYSNSFSSPSMSSSSPNSKISFTSPVPAAVTTPTLPTTSETMNGPSHNYGMYPQQTGFVPGAIAHTMAVNQTNNTGYQEDFYLSTISPETEAFDFNASPSQATMDLELSQADCQQFFTTVNPNSIEQNGSPLSQTSSIGRLWPGAHSQAALAKAQAQQRQQQFAQQKQSQRQTPQKPRGKASHPSDPIVEQKITQLLNSMRAKPAGAEPESQSSLNNLIRSKKDEEDMDEDERLLASEEGKKLSSKERRQLRNKVSARAFRSRRKEYITQLELEITNKVNENGDLRSQNRALLEENKRLSDLTRMLLSSPSFSNFLDNLSSNPNALHQAAPVKVEPNQQPEQNQIPKNVNPHNGDLCSQQQISMAMIPESSMDFSVLSADNATFNFQPQVFVVDTSEVPNTIDASVLSGKTSNLIAESFSSEEEKIEVPVIERLGDSTPAERARSAFVDEEFEADPEFALFHSGPAPGTETSEHLDTENLMGIDIFGGIDSGKVLARFELVDASEEETWAAIAMARVQRISASIDPVVQRLELLTMDL
ncbi:uncharacterized protein UV8b_06132 [Ustilaginoidea virens]|uniref:BZIP domain-containing protein n=1 Tax=Ustilaginoidea virens TaxID=1159556 RepID=A0A063CEX3_USTVR|nr:uncharacterized protein UV8b_06132 [Ustilaginoidea virens]QUC21891.1 hypothetical protein UV8b_06132 [Ustilaginoidea virens]GAO17410.1 hypothetical protein UVI_02024110 [Ustilaginoidea virens]